MVRVASYLVILALVGCASRPPPADPDAPHGAAHREPISSPVDVHTECPTGSPIYLGETPNGVTGTFLTLRGGSTSHLARDAEGNLTVWLVDDKGFGLAHVRVTRKMKRVEIGRSCQTLHAD
jgi:hypothetical protein